MSSLIERCGHCGREGIVESIQHVVVHSRTETLPAGPEPGHVDDIEYQTVVEVARCGSCHGVSLTQYTWIDPYFDSPDDAMDVRLLYPVARETADLPERVRRRYVDMLDLLHAPDAFAVRAGRLLEAVCLDQGVPRERNGRRLDLYDRLELLVSAGHLPQGLADQAHLVRTYRNLGGHDDEIEPTAEDLPLIRGFVEALLDFLYWGPAKLERGKADLQQRRDAISNSVFED